MNDRAISNLLIEVGISLIPFVGIDFQQGFHQKLWPELHQIASSWQDGHLFVVAGNTVINFNQALFAHESQLDPVLAAR